MSREEQINVRRRTVWEREHNSSGGTMTGVT